MHALRRDAQRSARTFAEMHICLLNARLTLSSKRGENARLAGVWRRRRSMHPSSILSQELPANENTAAHTEQDVEKLTVCLSLCNL